MGPKVNTILADPGEARGCSTNTIVTDSLIDSFSDPSVKIFVRRRYALMVEDGAFSHKIDVPIFFVKSKS